MPYKAYGYYRPEPDCDEYLERHLENATLQDKIDAAPNLFSKVDEIIEHLDLPEPSWEWFEEVAGVGYTEYMKQQGFDEQSACFDLIYELVDAHMIEGNVSDECPEWLKKPLENAIEAFADANSDEIDAILTEQYKDM